MPDGTFDVGFVGELTAVDGADAIVLLGAGARYGVSDDLEVSIALLRFLIKTVESQTLIRARRYPPYHHVAPARNADIDAPILGASLRLFDGAVSMAARLEVEVPLQDDVEVGASLPLVFRLGQVARIDIVPAIVAVIGDFDRSAAIVAFEGGVQPFSRLYLAGRLVADIDRFGTNLRPGGRITWTVGEPDSASFEIGVAAQVDVPIDKGLPSPVGGDPVSVQLMIRGFFDDDD